MEMESQTELTIDQRIELIKRVGNAQLDYVKRLYDRRPIAER
jgi:hypothetical protein